MLVARGFEIFPCVSQNFEPGWEDQREQPGKTSTHNQKQREPPLGERPWFLPGRLGEAFDVDIAFGTDIDKTQPGNKKSQKTEKAKDGIRALGSTVAQAPKQKDNTGKKGEKKVEEATGETSKGCCNKAQGQRNP